MPKASAEQRKHLSEASEDLAIAQREVERAMLELTADTPRAQKTIVTDSLRIAFEKVSAARAKLFALTTGEARK
jgi:hypothetical protein